MSGDRLAFLDPHEKYFEGTNENGEENVGNQAQSGTYFLLSDTDDRATMNTYPDQFAPFSQVREGGGGGGGGGEKESERTEKP